MADRTYRIGIEIDTRMRVDEQAAQKVRQAVSGATRPLRDLGQSAADAEARIRKAIAGITAEEQAFGRSARTLQQQIQLRRELARTMGAAGRPIPQSLVQETREFERMQGRTFTILGQEVSVGRVIAWGIAWTLAYRALNLVTSLIAGSTIGAIRTLAQFQQQQIALAAELVNIDPARPFDSAMRASRGLLDALIQLQPQFVGTQQRLQEILVGTQRYGIAVDFATKEGRRNFLAFANAIALSTAGIDRQGQGLQEIRSLSEGVVRPGAQLLQILKAIDPEITKHLRLWRAQGTVIENVARLLPGYEQAVERITGTLTGQINRLNAEVERFKRTLGEVQEGAFIALIRELADILERLRRAQTGEIAVEPGRGAVRGQTLSEQMRREAERRFQLRQELEAREAIALEMVYGRLRHRAGQQPPEPFTFEELQRMFERRRTLQQFTTAGEMRAVGEVLIPRLEEDLKAARELAELVRGTAQEDALKEVHRLELELTRLEGQRIGLAERLGQEYRRQADSLERAAEAVLDISARAREAAAGVGIGAAGMFESLLRGQLGGGRTAGDVREAFGGIRGQQEFVFRQRRALLDQAEREVRGESRIGERERQERLARIAQERIRLLFDETEARARLNREERESVRNAKQRDTDAELVFLRQKLQILKSIGDEQQAQNVRTRIQEIEKQQEFGADVAGLSTAQIRQLISESTRAILSGRLSLSQDRQMRERVEALQRRLRELEEERATEAGDRDRTRQAAKEAAGIYTDVLGPAFEFLRGEAESVADAVLKRAQELHVEIVAAYGRMGQDAGAAFRRGFEDEFGRGPGLFGPPQPAAPGRGPRNDLMQPTASRTNFTHSGANIFINGMEIALSESAKQEIVSAVMGGQGDVAMARERRLVGPGAVA